MAIIGGLLLFGMIAIATTLIFFIFTWIDDGFLESVKTLLIGLIISAIFIVPSIYLIKHADELSKTPKEYIILSESKIIALKDNSNISGSFSGSIFISSGYIEQQMYYFYMYETDKGKMMGKVVSDKTYVVETNEKSPSIICKQEKYKDERANYWLEPSAIEYYIYVPKGTIDTTYKINLQ